MNVALTRSKYFLFVIGNYNTLKGDDYWTNMIMSSKLVDGGYFEFNKYQLKCEAILKSFKTHNESILDQNVIDQKENTQTLNVNSEITNQSM